MAFMGVLNHFLQQCTKNRQKAEEKNPVCRQYISQLQYFLSVSQTLWENDRSCSLDISYMLLSAMTLKDIVVRFRCNTQSIMIFRIFQSYPLRDIASFYYKITRQGNSIISRFYKIFSF